MNSELLVYSSYEADPALLFDMLTERPETLVEDPNSGGTSKLYASKYPVRPSHYFVSDGSGPLSEDHLDLIGSET